MKMKRVWAWLLILAMCFMLVSCAQDTNGESTTTTTQNATTTTTASGQGTENPVTPPSSTATPLLYRVTDDDGHTIWLFGSIHVGRESYYPLPTYVQTAFESAEVLAVEADIVAFEKDLNAQIQALSHMVYLDGSNIKDHIPTALYDKAVAILKEFKTYMSVLDMYYPALWGSTIDSLMVTDIGGDPALGIDRHLIDAAYEAEKEIVEIESAQIQYKMLADFDEDIQLMMLESAVESYENKEETAEGLAALMDLWASGDERAFAAYLNTPDATVTEDEKALLEEYNRIMVTERNLTMAAYAEEALVSGKDTFICVGAAHVVGEGALADLLARRGYMVTRITK